MSQFFFFSFLNKQIKCLRMGKKLLGNYSKIKRIERKHKNIDITNIQTVKQKIVVELSMSELK